MNWATSLLVLAEDDVCELHGDFMPGCRHKQSHQTRTQNGEGSPGNTFNGASFRCSCMSATIVHVACRSEVAVMQSAKTADQSCELNIRWIRVHLAKLFS